MFKKVLLGVLGTSLLLSGCGQVQQQEVKINETTNQERSPTFSISGQGLPLIVNGQNNGNIGAVRQADQTYVPLEPFFNALGYTIIQSENGDIQIGYTDPIYTIQGDSTYATVDEQPITLPHAVTIVGNQTFASIPTLQTLLEADYDVRMEAGSLFLTPHASLFPEDDSWDNFKEDEEAVPTVTRAEANRIISRAKKYLGVKYVFGARTGRTNAFDCSSYVQYLYAKEGIRLPRVSRAQAAKGTYVRVANLKPGDLLYFSVPGRFRNDRTVGHVGIYMGNGRMIHASPPRVQITNVAKSSYWKSVYLGAKRVG